METSVDPTIETERRSWVGKRELAAHLVDGVIPDVPTRQSVLTMPSALRLHLAADPDLCRDVASALIDAVLASYVRRARSAGALGAPGSFAMITDPLTIQRSLLHLKLSDPAPTRAAPRRSRGAGLGCWIAGALVPSEGAAVPHNGPPGPEHPPCGASSAPAAHARGIRGIAWTAASRAPPYIIEAGARPPTGVR